MELPIACKFLTQELAFTLGRRNGPTILLLKRLRNSRSSVVSSRRPPSPVSDCGPPCPVNRQQSQSGTEHAPRTGASIAQRLSGSEALAEEPSVHSLFFSFREPVTTTMASHPDCMSRASICGLQHQEFLLAGDGSSRALHEAAGSPSRLLDCGHAGVTVEFHPLLQNGRLWCVWLSG